MRNRPLILIADDEHHIRLSMTLLLEEAGYEVMTVSSGLEALNYICQERVPDLLITDLDMPDISGTELIKDMAVLFPQLPFIVVTGYDKGDVLNTLPSDNCLTFMHKPYNEADLFNTVEQFLKKPTDSDEPKDTWEIPATYT